jgi:hypothetical protein
MEVGLYGFRYESKYYLLVSNDSSSFDKLGRSLLQEIKEMIQFNEYKEWNRKFKKLTMVKQNQLPNDNDYFMIKHILKINIEKNETDKIWPILLNHCHGSFRKILDLGYLFVNFSISDKDFINYTKNYNYIYILNFDEHLFTAIIDRVINNYFVYL